jgi:hypothetical protein
MVQKISENPIRIFVAIGAGTVLTHETNTLAEELSNLNMESRIL